MKRILTFFSLITLLTLSAIGWFGFTQAAHAQCIESPNDTFNCDADDNDGINTMGNGIVDVVNLNRHIVNNAAGNGIDAWTVTVNGGGVVIGSANGISAINGVTVNQVVVTGNNGAGISAVFGNVDVTKSGVVGSTFGINSVFGNVTTDGAIIIGNNADGISNVNGSVSTTGGSVTGNTNGITTVIGNVTTNGTIVTGSTGNGILTVNGNIDLTGGSVSGNLFGINTIIGTVTTDGTIITGSTIDGITTVTGNVDVIGGSVSGNIYGINTVTGTVTTNGTIVTGNTGTGIHNVTGLVDVNGGSVSGSVYGIQSDFGTAVVVDSATITGGTAAIITGVTNNTVTLTNTTDTPVINGLMDGGIGTDTLVGQQRANGTGAYVETIYNCANTALLCSTDPISVTAKGNIYTFDNFEEVKILRWNPF